MKTYHVHAIEYVEKNLHVTTKTLNLHCTSIMHQLTSYNIKNNYSQNIINYVLIPTLTLFLSFQSIIATWKWKKSLVKKSCVNMHLTKFKCFAN